MTGATEEAGKAVNTLIEAMKSAPLALALLVVNAAFLGFAAGCSRRSPRTRASAMRRRWR